MNRLRISFAILLFLLIALGPLGWPRPVVVRAYNCTSAQNGNWSDASTWTNCNGGVPTSTDDVSISHTVTLAQDESVNTLTINSGGLLSLNGYTLNVYGNWTNNGSFHHDNGAVRFAATSGSQTLSGSTTFCDVDIDLASGVTFDWGNSATTTIAGNLSKSTNGTLNAGINTTVKFTGDCKSGGSVVINGPGAKRFVHLQIASGANVQNTDGSIYVYGDFTNHGVFTQSSAVNFNFDDDVGYNTHDLNGSGSTTFGSLYIAGGANIVNASSDITISGSRFNITSGSTFNGGSNTVTFSGSTTSLGGAGNYYFHHFTIASGAAVNGKTHGDDTIYVSGNWTNNGVFTHNSSKVVFNGSSTQTIGGSSTTVFYDMAIDSGATVVVPVTNQPQADNDVANNGTLRQTRTVSGATSFLNIKSSGGVDEYFGMDLNGSGGGTQVDVSGNQDSCPNVPSGSYPVKRCYAITPGSSGSVAATFYYEYGELRSADGQDPATLYVWRDNGDGTWTKITPDSRSACTAGIQCSVTVNSLSLASATNRYVLANYNPQAVAMASFDAAWTPDGAYITWETVSEFDLLGFNLYRSGTEDGPWMRINDELILSPSPGSPEGRLYTWLDVDAPVGRDVYYRLEWVMTDGSKATVARIVLRSQLPHQTWLPLLW